MTIPGPAGRVRVAGPPGGGSLIIIMAWHYYVTSQVKAGGSPGGGGGPLARRGLAPTMDSEDPRRSLQVRGLFAFKAPNRFSPLHDSDALLHIWNPAEEPHLAPLNRLMVSQPPPLRFVPCKFAGGGEGERPPLTLLAAHVSDAAFRV